MRSEGIIRDGVQRNIEVVAIYSGGCNAVSLYPSYSLAHAVRAAVLQSDGPHNDYSSLVDAAEKLVSSVGINMDVKSIVAKFGIEV